MEAKAVSAPKSKKSPTCTDRNPQNNKKVNKKKKKQKKAIVGVSTKENVSESRDRDTGNSDLDGSDLNPAYGRKFGYL